MNELKVIVVGAACTGKTTMAYKIAKLLKEEGFNVELVPDMDGVGYEMLPLDSRAESLKETTKIVVDQLQAKRQSRN